MSFHDLAFQLLGWHQGDDTLPLPRNAGHGDDPYLTEEDYDRLVEIVCRYVPGVTAEQWWRADEKWRYDCLTDALAAAKVDRLRRGVLDWYSEHGKLVDLGVGNTELYHRAGDLLRTGNHTAEEYQRVLREAVPTAPVFNPDDLPPGFVLTQPDEKVLRYLLERYPCSRVQEDIESGTDLSHPTVFKSLRRLEEVGLVRRAVGNRSGYTLTDPSGLRLAKHVRTIPPPEC